MLNHKLDGIYYNHRSEFIRDLHYVDTLLSNGSAPFWLEHLRGLSIATQLAIIMKLTET